ncbi:MAG: trp operon repressor [Chlamydiales bacterium]|nr:trp operon repressor [Chlamydiales bacterium]
MERKLIAEAGWKGFKKLCEEAVKEGHLEALLKLFLTLEEQENLSLRFVILKSLIENKKPQREISRDLHLSISKITRGSNALKILDPDFEVFLKKQI